MSGAINLGTYQAADGGQVTLSVQYNDALKATQFQGTNASQGASFGAKIVGNNPDGTENAAATYALILPPGVSDFVAIPASGAGSIQLATNSKGKVVGFDTYTGI